MVINVSKHAISRYKKRISGKRTSSGQRCTEQIKAAVRGAYRVIKLNDTDKQYNYGAYRYFTNRFMVIIQKSSSGLYVVTIEEYRQNRQSTIPTKKDVIA